jgi:DNA-binding NtrC family response regulator
MSEEHSPAAYKRILIVDDEEQVVFVMRNSLKKLGPMYEIVTASSGQEALDKLREAPADLVITDLAMPGIHGLELTESVLAHAPQTKVIWVTAYDQWQAEAERLGVYRYILKPLDLEQIRDAARTGLGGDQPAPGPVSGGAQTRQEQMPHGEPPTRSEQTPQPVASSESAPRAEQEQDTRPKILVMEDTDDLRRLYSKTLEKAGYHVYGAATLQAAQDLLAQHRFAVFLSDIRMDAGLGIDLVREHLDDLNAQGTSVIMVSAEARYRDICEQMGIDFYVEKPVALAPLVTLVNRLTGRK